MRVTRGPSTDYVFFAWIHAYNIKLQIVNHPKMSRIVAEIQILKTTTAATSDALHAFISKGMNRVFKCNLII